MKAQDIRPGLTLRLKPDRQKAYGKASPLVTVSGLSTRPGYKTPWVDAPGIWPNIEYFRPSDFSGAVWEESL